MFPQWRIANVLHGRTIMYYIESSELKASGSISTENYENIWLLQMEAKKPPAAGLQSATSSTLARFILQSRITTR